MMVFTSIYGVVDGFFVSNFAGKTPFAAVNLIIPFLMIVATVGFMFGTGGTAIVAKAFGEGDSERANRYFSLFVYVAFGLGVIIAVLGFIFIRPISILLGGPGGVAGKLRGVCPHYSGGAAFLRLPAAVPELFRHRRKAPSGPGGDRLLRPYQHGAGRRAGDAAARAL